MSQLENAAMQAARATSHREHGVLRPMLLAAGGLLLAQMFAGYLFLWWIGSPPASATPLTVVRYAYYFGDRPDIRRALLICSALGIGGMGVAALVALLPKTRALHGDARFARRQELAGAG